MLKNLFSLIWEKILVIIKSRVFFLGLIFVCLSCILIYRLFELQIVNGQEYLENFELKIQKERTLTATRGNIYDCNGNLLAYNELAYSVTIEDVYESGSSKNKNLNDTLYRAIKIIEENGDTVVNSFEIALDEHHEFYFTISGKQLLRFLADIYGKTSIDDLKYEEETSTAQDIIDLLCSKKRYGIGDYVTEGSEKTFVPGLGYTKDEILKLVTIRYAMSANSYQKYIATTIATDVSDETVAVIMENKDSMDGIDVAEDTIRKYVNSVYFSQIIGYTGRISTTELTTLKEQDETYTMNDYVGKDGIEQYMELELQGTKGKETVYVDNMGKVIDTSDIVEPSAGNDVYLTIDMELQIATYKLLEQKIAGILVANIKNVKESSTTGSDKSIPIYEVYFALINNNVIDISHFSEQNASDTEKEVYESFLNKRSAVLEKLGQEMLETGTGYSRLSKEYKNYESYIVAMLENTGIIDTSLYDKTDSTYIAWKSDESISLKTYLQYCISKNWIDITRFGLSEEDKYSSTEELYNLLVDYCIGELEGDRQFHKKMYYYMIMDDKVTGRQLCKILVEQDVTYPGESYVDRLYNNKISAYDFLLYLISNLLITPAQLALDPCSGSAVITDIETGEVKALVSYPSYDNNKLANTVNAKYYAALQSDLSNPLWNYATQQRTAPGSTFKMVSATAGLEENVISRYETILCRGVFDKLYPTIHRCWIHPGAHGELNVVGGIKNSCNCFFYEVGYRMSMLNGTFHSDYGLERLQTYAELYGLTTKSGVEIRESDPSFSTQYSVPSFIGQGTHNYTTVGLSRYVTTVANSGICYDLTLLKKVTDSNGHTVISYKPEDRIVNRVDLAQSTWDAIHMGMREVVLSKAYFNDLGVNVAGKTGTAQEDKTRPNHALFVSYAPYEAPEISVVVRIANGYSSSYAAEAAKDIYQYYYGLKDEEELLNGVADELESNGGNTD